MNHRPVRMNWCTRLRRERFHLYRTPATSTGPLPIGNFYFHQAGLLAVPGVFLAAWWVLIPLPRIRVNVTVGIH
ncbi:hypothetical protein [Actinophytocola sp.]|uniref:hypothetical protein n=1 Tax=Actinophytocola sp. TaxID=1872138 RepID=UPI00389AA462